MNKRARSPSPNGQAFHLGITPLTDCRRTDVGRAKNIQSDNDNAEYVESPFGCQWEHFHQQGSMPPSRSGQSIIYSDLRDCIYFAYGQRSDNNYSSCFFEFSLKNMEWKLIPVEGATPRSNCGSCINGNRIWFFGGNNQSSCIRELHYLDLDTNTIVYPETKGVLPPPCTYPFLAFSYPNLIIWSSITGSNPSSLHILNTETMEWNQIITEHIFRQGSCGAVIGDSLYIFGATCPNTVLRFDINLSIFSIIKTSGDEPIQGHDNLFITPVGTSLLFISNAGNNINSHIFSFDTLRANWNCYSINPSSIEGNPIHLIYAPRQRSMIAVIDNEDSEHFTLASLQIGKSMSRLHHHLDFLGQLSILLVDNN